MNAMMKTDRNTGSAGNGGEADGEEAKMSTHDARTMRTRYMDVEKTI
jgi:hypothetical protein